MQYTQEQADAINAQFRVIAKKVRACFDSKRYAEATAILTNEALTLVPNHQIVLCDLAYSAQQQGDLEQAYRYLHQAMATNNNIASDVYDSLTSVCAKMNHFEEARYYARLSLKTKKRELAANPPEIDPIPDHAPLGLSEDESRNVICFSLFGSNPRYCEPAIINVNLAKKIYPQWTCRFYIDDSVPERVVKRLEKNGAQVIKVDEKQKAISGLFWRFFVFDDPTVQCAILRDADSLLSYKEAAAVNEWIQSGKWFHIMRDALEHSELILAGMWGGYTGVFRNMQQKVSQHFEQLWMLNKTIDQVFLRQLYPTLAQSLMIHDNLRLDPDSVPFPEYELSPLEKIPYFHIGMIDAHMKTTFIHLHQPAKRVLWYLKNEKDEEVCAYEAEVTEEKEGKPAVRINLPYFYSNAIEQQRWRFCYSVLE